MRLLGLIIVVYAIATTASAQDLNPLAIEDLRYGQLLNKRVKPKVNLRIINITPAELGKLVISYEIRNILESVDKTAKLSPDGNFSLEFDYSFPYQEFFIEIVDVYFVRLFAVDGLTIQLDYSKVKASGKELTGSEDGLRYSGSDAPLNEFINEYSSFRKDDQTRLRRKLSDVPGFQLKNPDSVAHQIRLVFDSLKLIQVEYLAGRSSEFGWILENERRSDMYGKLCFVYLGHPVPDALFEEVKAHRVYVMSGNSSKYYNNQLWLLTTAKNGSIRSGIDDLEALPDLPVHEKTAIQSIRRLTALSTKDARVTDSINRLYSSLQSTIVRNLAVKIARRGITIIDSVYKGTRADLMKTMLQTSKDPDDQKAVLAVIMPTLVTDWCIQHFAIQYASMARRVEAINKSLSQTSLTGKSKGPGTPILKTDFGAALYKAANHNAASFLQSLRQSFPGKAIIFDRWATWCGPCIREMPHSKQLQEESTDLPVIFVYACTSLGSDETRWKNQIADLRLPGVHIFIDEKLDADLTQYFNFRGYPGYAFINAQGVYKPEAFNHITDVKDRKALEQILKLETR